MNSEDELDLKILFHIPLLGGKVYCYVIFLQIFALDR